MMMKGYLVGIHDLVFSSCSFYLLLTIEFIIVSLLVSLFLILSFNSVKFISIKKG